MNRLSPPTEDEKAAMALVAGNGFVHWNGLFRPEPKVFEAIAIYLQCASLLDLHLRRIYFALISTGTNLRGPEKATLNQIIDRLPKAILESEFQLYESRRFIELLTPIKQMLYYRNDVAHSACRFDPNYNVLIFAHANESVGRSIKTGDSIAYWTLSTDRFLQLAQDFERVCRYIPQYVTTWLPRLRPWLPTYLDGVPVEDSEHAQRVFQNALDKISKSPRDALTQAISNLAELRDNFDLLADDRASMPISRKDLDEILKYVSPLE